MDRMFFGKLTQRERDIIKEVDRQYFFTRCIPLSIGAMVGVRYLMTRGIWSTKASFVKQTVAGFGGYIIGKTAGNSASMSRMMNEVPDGYLATLRNEVNALSDEEKTTYFKKMGETKEYDLPSVVLHGKPPGHFQTSSPVDPSHQPSYPSQQPSYPSKQPSYPSQPQQLPQLPDQSTTPPPQDIFERLQPNADKTAQKESDTEQQQQFSYSAQREKWLEGQGQSYKPESGGHESVPVKEEPTSGRSRSRKNKYGDEME